ncbi:hypothetical protein TRVL_10401 [Trypanosoma vivax]|nr:hypothetical protein TRVL_10401 [Trypanosoma vivax]
MSCYRWLIPLAHVPRDATLARPRHSLYFQPHAEIKNRSSSRSWLGEVRDSVRVSVHKQRPGQASLRCVELGGQWCLLNNSLVKWPALASSSTAQLHHQQPRN